jgi:hypothetical protein
MSHLLHKKVADCIESLISQNPHLSIIKDPACGGSNNIPFFLSEEAHNDTEITNVDFIVVKAGKIRLVCEIEESDITPIRTFGKVFTVVGAEFCKLKDGTNYALDPGAIFLQVLSSAKLKPMTKKRDQGDNIKEAVNKIIQSNKNSWIKKYHLIYGDLNDFNLGSENYIQLQNIVNKL